ncbi:MAG TPA: FosX/FosE/FosI family fosfomycin resistance hydrolase [Burkholderiaceae bacterium]|jgi:catechol 2,3-dioxygenase-like lactoylglutathione lyase family enzyme
MSIEGLSHITFVVRDLERSARLYCEGLGACEVYDSQGSNFSLSREKFLLMGGIWIALMQGDAPPERSYRHVAFKVDEGDLPHHERQLRMLGAEIQPARTRVHGEGVSLYFYDYDNNLIELHSGTLEQRLARYALSSNKEKPE